MRTINDLPRFSELQNADTVVSALKRMRLATGKLVELTKEQMAAGISGSSHHSFGAVYQQITEYLSDQEVVESVLEIGVQRGGSLLLWQDLSLAATVMGIDIMNTILPEVAETA